MPHEDRERSAGSQSRRFWMRAVSFPGLHRMLHAVASTPSRRTTALGINRLVVRQGLSLTRRVPIPSQTTLYHYRNTLVRIRALCRDGRTLKVNESDPHVRTLLRHSAPSNGDSLCIPAKESFAALVLAEPDCRSLFFDIFMPPETVAASVALFRSRGLPVRWRRDGPHKSRSVLFEHPDSGHTVRYDTASAISAVLYGLRYWASKELGLIDEFSTSTDGRTTMFPVYPPENVHPSGLYAVPPLVPLLLSERGPGDWTLFSVFDLITRHCRDGRRPISAMSDAIGWLVTHWSHHTLLIPTSHAMATLTATSPQHEQLALKRYYKAPHGPYISHFRLHSAIDPTHQPPPSTYARHPSDTSADI